MPFIFIAIMWNHEQLLGGRNVLPCVCEAQTCLSLHVGCWKRHLKGDVRLFRGDILMIPNTWLVREESWSEKEASKEQSVSRWKCVVSPGIALTQSHPLHSDSCVGSRAEWRAFWLMPHHGSDSGFFDPEDSSSIGELALGRASRVHSRLASFMDSHLAHSLALHITSRCCSSMDWPC